MTKFTTYVYEDVLQGRSLSTIEIEENSDDIKEIYGTDTRIEYRKLKLGDMEFKKPESEDTWYVSEEAFGELKEKYYTVE